MDARNLLGILEDAEPIQDIARASGRAAEAADAARARFEAVTQPERRPETPASPDVFDSPSACGSGCD